MSESVLNFLSSFAATVDILGDSGVRDEPLNVLQYLRVLLYLLSRSLSLSTFQ